MALDYCIFLITMQNCQPSTDPAHFIKTMYYSIRIQFRYFNWLLIHYISVSIHCLCYQRWASGLVTLTLAIHTFCKLHWRLAWLMKKWVLIKQQIGICYWIVYTKIDCFINNILLCNSSQETVSLFIFLFQCTNQV